MEYQVSLSFFPILEVEKNIDLIWGLIYVWFMYMCVEQKRRKSDTPPYRLPYLWFWTCWKRRCLIWYIFFFILIQKKKTLSFLINKCIHRSWNGLILIYIIFSNGIGPVSGETYQREASKPSQSMFPKLIHLKSIK